MSFEAESNSELTMIVPAYQLHFRCRTKYTNKKCCRTPGPPYLAVLPVLVIFCPLGSTNFKKSVLIRSTLPHFSNTRHLFLSAYFVVLCIDEKSFCNVYYCFKFDFSINARTSFQWWTSILTRTLIGLVHILTFGNLSIMIHMYYPYINKSVLAKPIFHVECNRTSLGSTIVLCSE